MTRFLIHPLVLFGAAAFCVGGPSGAAEITPVQLRYGVAGAHTNVYSVDLECQSEAGREAITGTFFVTSRPTGTNLAALSVRGQFRVKAVGPMSPPMGMRPGGVVPLSAYTFGFQGQERELLLDDRGQILRQAGDLSLPIPLGQLAASLIQPFPADATVGWEDQADVFVLDEPSLQGPAAAFLNPPGGMGYPGFFPGRGAQGILKARQRTRVKVTEVTANVVTLERSLSLDSALLTGTEPRVSASGTGQFEFDRALGLPRRIDWECKAVALTESLSRRSLLNLHWRLLEGTERDQALAPPAPPPAESKFSPDELARLAQQLKSTEDGERQAAARELSGPRLGTPTPELLSLAASLVGDRDDTLRRAALAILAAHGTKDHVPLLLKGLNDGEPATRAVVAKALGRLRDPRAIEPLVNLVASGQGDQPMFRPARESAAVEALVQMGAAAEPGVLTLLKEKNLETRCQACAILKQIGTAKSMSVLKDLTANSSKELSEAAAEACRSIQTRE